METRFHWFVRLSPVILAYENIELCKCSGKYIDIYFKLKITFLNLWPHGQNGPLQISGGPQKFYNLYWVIGLIYGPQFIEWSIELLLTTSP